MPPSLELAELASIIEYVTYKQSKRTPRFLESRMSYEPAVTAKGEYISHSPAISLRICCSDTIYARHINV